MDQIVFYVILGVIWLVIRLVSAGNKNKAKQAPPTGRPNPPANQRQNAGQQSQQTPNSFEDLLRQLGQNVEEEKPAPQPTYKAEPKPYYEQKQDYDGPLESVDRDYENEYTRYQEAINAGKKFERIEDRVSRIQNKETGKRFKSFDQEEEEPSYYAKLLQNPQSARDAIILAEILKRPYE